MADVFDRTHLQEILEDRLCHDAIDVTRVRRIREEMGTRGSPAPSSHINRVVLSRSIPEAGRKWKQRETEAVRDHHVPARFKRDRLIGTGQPVLPRIEIAFEKTLVSPGTTHLPRSFPRASMLYSVIDLTLGAAPGPARRVLSCR